MSVRTIRDKAISHLRETLQKTKQPKVAVIGDLMLDVYISGTTNRMSPEASVPILKEEVRSEYAGGAANTALNVARLGGKTTLLGVVGDDEPGKKLRTLIKEDGISWKVVTEKNFVTTTKTRALGEHGHLLRIDNEAVLPMQKLTESQLMEEISALKDQDMVIVSDYKKGVMTRNVIDMLKKKFDPRIIFVDTKPKDTELYRDIGLLKVNLTEAFEITGIIARSKSDAEQVVRSLSDMIYGSVVLTRGEKGMTVYDRENGTIQHIPAFSIEKKEVTGAGDTTLATLALMHAHGYDLETSAYAAAYIAAEAVSREGTSALTFEELFGKKPV